MVKSSPATTDRDDDSAADPRKFPAVDASQNDTWLYVSVVDTFVHAVSASVVIDPDAAAPNDVLCLVVFVAAFDDPAAPGSPV